MPLKTPLQHAMLLCLMDRNIIKICNLTDSITRRPEIFNNKQHTVDYLKNEKKRLIKKVYEQLY